MRVSPRGHSHFPLGALALHGEDSSHGHKDTLEPAEAVPAQRMARPRSKEAVGLGGAWRLGRQPAGEWPRGAGWPWQAGGVLQAKQLDGDGSLGRACRPAHHTQPSLVSRPRPQQAARAPRGEDTANTQYLPVERMSERMNERTNE